MSNKNKLVCAIGINDYDGVVYVNGKNIKSYDCWRHMLERCYSTKYQIRRPTYIGCTVSNEWLQFSNFKKWYGENYREGFELDKDILFPGNKVYSKDTCVFVPQYLNSLLTDHGRARGDYPLGITALKPNTRIGRVNTTFLAQCNDRYGNRLTKTFKTIEEASAWYSITKTRIVAEQVQRALSESAIDQRVADALLARKF
jgi:hypothetical protein